MMLLALFQIAYQVKWRGEGTDIFVHGDKEGYLVVWSVGYNAEEECIEIWKRAP